MGAPAPEPTIHGRVKWFNVLKGYGFILDDDGQEYFVHFTMILKDGYRVLRDGDLVEFAPADGPKGRAARNVRRIKPDLEQDALPADKQSFNGHRMRTRAKALAARLDPIHRPTQQPHIGTARALDMRPSFVTSAAANFQDICGPMPNRAPRRPPSAFTPTA
jgi:CspA family cold shock protein